MHLQTLWLPCGRRETTAAHISTAWASPGQEAELAVARRGEGQAGLRQSHSQEALASGRAGYNIWGGLVQKLVSISSWQQPSLVSPGPSGGTSTSLVHVSGLFA